MNIERNELIRFHERGTLEAVTRWIASHHDGIAEWFKNVRRQYQVDRANVLEDHKVAILLLQDTKGGKPARIGVLDVGGATLEDVTAWSTWQDPDASRRASLIQEEETQGNGGKAYMYRLFSGPACIVGVRDRRRNCKGFDGDNGSVERGTPGWIPTIVAGRDVEISSFEAELESSLQPYEVTIEDLPESIRTAITKRQAFTLVEGENPVGLYKGRIDADDIIARVVRHEQSILCLEQVGFYVIHNGRIVNDGHRLQVPPITPYPGFETPFVSGIPEQLPMDNGQLISTTEGGSREAGRVTLHTSAENMPAAYKNLRPRWQIIYRTKYQMIGGKAVSDVAGTMPGAQFVYGTVELPALEPAYVEHGRRRPKDGPLVEALDRFVSEKIKEIAHQISAQRQERLDEHALDEVYVENRRLDELKNRFLPNSGEGNGGRGGGGTGPGSGGGGGGGALVWGKIPEALECTVPENGIAIARGVSIHLRSLLDVKVLDANGRPVRSVLEWQTSDRHVAALSQDGVLQGKEKGSCTICVKVKGSSIESAPIPVEVWAVDHVLLTPRTVSIPLGKTEQLCAEVTDEDGKRSTDVLLEWRHDAEDQLTVRISRTGVVTGNRLGRTSITAGAGDTWARIGVDVAVIPNPERIRKGSGFPRLLLTGRDLDPATGTIREGDPDQPALWQGVSDYMHNVWWLNLQSSEAAHAFRQRATNSILWRTYHAERVVDMVVQVWMSVEFTQKGESQQPEFWASHLAAQDRHRIRIVQEMWKYLQAYISVANLTEFTIGESE
ncbi:MAG: Ig-like domain-containing protein [Ignavibacteria bacterium]|nr:Ig-like domain-containing protein [Ignavibacteria bacterium]